MRTILAIVLLGLTVLANAGSVEPRVFDTPEQESRYKSLIQELRCLVCQNQNLADSNADLAKDLRVETYNMIRAGKSDEQIVTFMVDRYGDFVLYRPPVKSTTALLWFGPAALALIAVIFVLLHVRRRARGAPEELSDEERRRLDEILKPGREEKSQ